MSLGYSGQVRVVLQRAASRHPAERHRSLLRRARVEDLAPFGHHACDGVQTLTRGI